MSSRGLLAHRAVMVAAALLVSACSPRQPSARFGRPAIHLQIAFTCLWWSEVQMEGMNPNAAPPKSTEVILKKWEYSDPIAVPHPDAIDVVITLANAGDQPVTQAEVQLDAHWKDGRMHEAGSARWSQRNILKRFQNVSVPASDSQTLRVPVDLKSMMDSLRKQQLWPYALRVTATVRLPGSTEPATEVAAELPIASAD